MEASLQNPPLAKSLLQHRCKQLEGAAQEQALIRSLLVGSQRRAGTHIPHPDPVLSPTPHDAKIFFQICRLNTFLVHFRPFILYPTSLGSGNMFPSFHHSISQRVFIDWEVSLPESSLSYTAYI